MSIDAFAKLIEPLDDAVVAALFDDKALKSATLNTQITQMKAKQNAIRAERDTQNANVETEINDIQSSIADIQKQIDALQ